MNVGKPLIVWDAWDAWDARDAWKTLDAFGSCAALNAWDVIWESQDAWDVIWESLQNESR